MGKRLVLRNERGGRHLRHHQPGVQASGRHEKSGQVRQRGVQQFLDAPLGNGGQVRGRDGGIVEDVTDGSAVEIAAGDDVPAPREDERVVRRAVHLALENLARVLEGVACRPVDLRHASQRVVVLDAAATPVRFADRASREERPQVRRRRDRARMGPRADDPRVECGVRAACGIERRGAGDVRDAREIESAFERESSDGDRHLHAVDEREPFLGGEGHGREPSRLERLRRAHLPAPVSRSPLADEAERQVRERSEVA